MSIMLAVMVVTWLFIFLCRLGTNRKIRKFDDSDTVVDMADFKAKRGK